MASILSENQKKILSFISDEKQITDSFYLLYEQKCGTMPI